MTTIDTDVLIVGAGAAGLVTALNVRRRRVCILSPDGDDRNTASDYAQGGIAAAIGANDSPALHLRDTLMAGCKQNTVSAAQYVCRRASDAIEYLETLGLEFTRVDGVRSLNKEAAHCRARVLHAGGDTTGAALMHVLRRRIAEAPHVEMLPYTRAVSLICDSSGVNGVLAVTEDGRTITVRARAVVIASGGVGGLYSRTTNPPGACGDGLAMALAAGARCNALEFVQFHPTALDVDARPLPLMTEALRGAGAHLVDDTGAAIMRDVHPLADLAPRDVVARTIYALQSTGGRAWLDATHLEGGDIADTFPSAFRLCRAHGIDPRRQPIPITPAAHYHMGGIAVDLDGRTSLPRLWAVGEAACTGMHGANRLASNSLLEGVVLGRRLGRALSCEFRDWTRGAPSLPVECSEIPEPSCERELREVMWRCMGVVRSARSLSEGLAFVARLREQAPLQSTLRRSRLLLAERMMTAAARRSASCGAHYRIDSDLTYVSLRPRACG